MRTNGKPKSRFALVVVADTSYFRGLNAIVNAMDYYGNAFDLILILHNASEAYVDSILAADFDFRIEVVDHEEIKGAFMADVPVATDEYAVSCFIRHWFVRTIKDRYSVVGLMEADALLLDDITPWFELVEGTDYLLTAFHDYHNYQLENYLAEHLDVVQPLYIHPLFCDPKKWDDVFETIGKIGPKSPTISDMMAMNQAVLLCGKKEKVVVLPGDEWLGGFVYTSPAVPMTLSGGKRILTTSTGNMKIKMLHGKYYSDGFRYGVCQQSHPENREVFKNNMITIHELFRFFNDDLKVKLPTEYRLDMDRVLL